MLDKVCQILKGIAVIGWFCISQIDATTCTATSSTTLQTCLNNVAAGDTVEIKGIESGITTHYRRDSFTISGRNGGCGARITIKPFGYSGPGTGDTVIFDGGNDSANAWTHCTFSSGACQGACSGWGSNQTACLETWYQAGTGSYNLASWVVKPDGSPAFKVRALTSMTNAHTNSPLVYNTKRCSTKSWLACDTTMDCPSAGNCTAGLSPEKDFYYNAGVAYLRSGTTTPSDYYLINDSNAIGMLITNSCNITVEGLTFLTYARSAIGTYPGSAPQTGIIFDDITGYYFLYTDGGPDYAAILYDAADPIVRNSNFAYSQSELIHTESPTSTYGTAMALDFHNNWLHNAGDSSILGEMLIGGPLTPGAMILGNRCSGCSNASSYAGSDIYGNLIQDIKFFARNGDGIKFENVFNGSAPAPVKVHDNFIVRVANNAFRFDTIFDNSSYIDIYNNIVVNSGTNPNSSDGTPRGAAFEFTASSKNLTNVNIMNNTVWQDNNGPAVSAKNLTGTTSIIFRNNIFANTQDVIPVSWVPTALTNLFENNILWSTNPVVISFGGIDYTSCSLFNATAAGESDHCESPAFYDPTGYMFYPIGGSGLDPKSANIETNATFNPPTLDAGTATGQPAAHTAGIVNALATTHGFGFYSDSVSQGGDAWDIGATESYIAYPRTPVGWTTYVPSSCSGTAGTGVGTTGGGFVFRTQRDPSRLCNGVSTTLTLTVGQKYLVYFREQVAKSFNDVTVDGSTPPNYSLNSAAPVEACLGDNVDDWHLDATNATISEVRYADGSKGGFAPIAGFAHTFLLIPTSASVTLKAEVVAAAFFSTCPDLIYAFDPITVVPVRGVCSVTRYQSCDPSSSDPGCPTGESCS